MHVTKKQRDLAEELGKMDTGQTLKRSLLNAGYSENVSNRGWESVPNRVVKLLAKKGIRLKELGKIDAETQEQIVRGRLVYNTIKGSDKGVLSAKALGSDRRVAMFQAESSVGIVVISAPTAMVEQKARLLADDPEDTNSRD